MAPISGLFRAAPGLRLRPVPEWDSCLVLDPERAALHELNVTAWLLLELAEGLGYSEIVAAYQEAVGPRRDRPALDVRTGLLDLVEAGLLERLDAPDATRRT